MAKVNTQWNPVFGGLNFMRDFSSAMANLSSTELKGEQKAIAKGIPTICTNFSACEEFAEMSVPLGYSLSDYKMSGIYENAGYWAKPDYDDLCDKMLYVTKHYEEVSEKTYSSAVYINENMTWQKVAKGYADRLCQILK
jgi:hypothetical protein